MFPIYSFSNVTSQGTYSWNGHEDIHRSRPHCDKLDVILLDSCAGIYIICIVVDLRRKRESNLMEAASRNIQMWDNRDTWWKKGLESG